MSLAVWRGGKECGLRVHQSLTNRHLWDRHCPAVRVVTMRAPDGAWQRKTNFAGPYLSIGAHRLEQIIHVARVGPLDRQIQALERRLDTLRRAGRSDAQCLGQ